VSSNTNHNISLFLSLETTNVERCTAYHTGEKGSISRERERERERMNELLALVRLCRQ